LFNKILKNADSIGNKKSICISTIFSFQPLESDLKGGDMARTRLNKSLISGLVLGMAIMLLMTSPALAVETKWKALVPGNWNDSANWTNNDVPKNGYDVIIDLPGADVTYLIDKTTHSSNPTLNSLRLGLDPLDTTPLDPDLEEFFFTQNQILNQDLLTVKNSEIGSKGTANYFQNGGSHKVLQNLTLGTAADGEGLYYMMGGSLSVGGHETLGLAGQGYLLQSGNNNSSLKTPSLECTPPVTPPPPVNPIHTVGKNLYLGVKPFIEEGKIKINGEINLSFSSLTVGGSTKIGIKGKALFDQNDSIVKIKGNYYPDPKFGEGTLSSSPDFSPLSKKNLKNNKMECVSSQEPGLIVGLENEGDYNLTGGTLNVNYSEIIGLDEGGVGTFTQKNGTHTINGNLYLGKERGSLGSFVFFGPPLSLDTPFHPEVGLLDVHGFASVGYLSEGILSKDTDTLMISSFSQDGGKVMIRGIDQEVNHKGKSFSNNLFKGSSLSCSPHQQNIGLTIGRGGKGSYSLDDGELHVSHGEIIGMLPKSNGTFNQFGGNHFIDETLTIARDKDSLGTYNLYDGMLSANGGVVNNDTFNFFGGLIKGKVTNNGNFNVIIPDPKLNILITADRMVSGDFINNKGGVVLVKNTNVTFTKGFQNKGKYESILSSQTFKDLTVDPTGYLKAGSGDNITISGNFLNLRTQQGDWDTGGANVKFTGTGKHYFKTGSILEGDGSVKNFNWLSLKMDNGAVVVLQGHLKADQILEVKSDDQGKINNLKGFCGIRIDYLPGNNANTYLAGKKLYSTGDRHIGTFTSNGFVSVACQ
jgi:hypothetical protein